MPLHKLVVAPVPPPPTDASLPFLTFIIYVIPGSDLNALIKVPLKQGDIWQLDALGLPMHAIFSPTPSVICYDEVWLFCCVCVCFAIHH